MSNATSWGLMVDISTSPYSLHLSAGMNSNYLAPAALAAKKNIALELRIEIVGMSKIRNKTKLIAKPMMTIAIVTNCYRVM
jgi:hypothetical protein